MNKIIVMLCISFISLAQDDCTQFNAKELKKEQKLLEVKVEQIKQYLDGKEVIGFSPLVVFGADFKISQTKARIEKNTRIIEQFEGFESVQDRGCAKRLLSEQEFDKHKNLLKEFTNYKIKLLQKNQILNDGVRTANETQNNLPELLKNLDAESKNISDQKIVLKNEIDKKENKLSTETDGKNKDLITFESNLVKLKLELLERKMELISSLEKKISYFTDINNQISVIFKESLENEGVNKEESFNKVQELWLRLSTENYYDLLKTGRKTQIPAAPILPETIKATPELDQRVDEVKNLRLEIIKYANEKKHQELTLLNDLIVSCSGLRSTLYLKLGRTYFWKQLGSLSIFNVLKNEILFSPYRIISYFYSIYLKTLEKIELGRSGYIDIFVVVLKYALFMIPIFLLRYFFVKIDSGIDVSLRNLIIRFKTVKTVLHLSAIWVKFRESLSPILWIILINIFKTSNDFQQFKYLLTGCEIIFLSRILHNIIVVFLGSISKIDTNSFREFKIKSEQTSQKFEDIYLIYAFTMLFLEATIGRAFVYSLIYYAVLFYSLYQLINEATLWQDEFEVYLEKKFAGVITKNIFATSNFLPKKIQSVYVLIFILILTIVDIIISFTENFDFSKKVSANLFKKQIEKIEAEEDADIKIPSSYKELFSIRSLEEATRYVNSGAGLEEKVLEEVDIWALNDSEEHSLVFYGDKGVGKTTLIKHLMQECKNKELNVKYIKIPSKTCTKEALNVFLASIFNTAEFNIHDVDHSLEKKTVIFLDEAQNIFLSQTGGFEAYYTLIDIINQTTKNIFWILSFNKYSWLYLDRAFGRTQFFRNVIELKGWSDLKIKELIMKRHDMSEHKLSYDLLISATSSQDEIDRYSSIESKFFKLLWEISRGNPRYALILWISALSRKNARTFNVNVPKFVEVQGLDKLSDDLMFVLADVLKHENLTSNELQQTTNLATGIVRNAIKMGLERKYFYKDERGRYMIELALQYPIIKFLRLKNFIYGN